MKTEEIQIESGFSSEDVLCEMDKIFGSRKETFQFLFEQAARLFLPLEIVDNEPPEKLVGIWFNLRRQKQAEVMLESTR